MSRHHQCAGSYGLAEASAERSPSITIATRSCHNVPAMTCGCLGRSCLRHMSFRRSGHIHACSPRTIIAGRDVRIMSTCESIRFKQQSGFCHIVAVGQKSVGIAIEYGRQCFGLRALRPTSRFSHMSRRCCNTDAHSSDSLGPIVVALSAIISKIEQLCSVSN